MVRSHCVQSLFSCIYMWFVAGHNEEISTLALQNDFQVYVS